jgi:hypothetical protein
MFTTAQIDFICLKHYELFFPSDALVDVTTGLDRIITNVQQLKQQLDYDKLTKTNLTKQQLDQKTTRPKDNWTKTNSTKKVMLRLIFHMHYSWPPK